MARKRRQERAERREETKAEDTATEEF